MQHRNTLGDTDGACKQAQVLLALLRGFTIEESWNSERHRYDAEIDVNRYFNCREQGYTLTLFCNYKQLIHVTFFEHRNSDSLCFLVYRGSYTNPPTVDDIYRDNAAEFPDKWHHSRSFNYGDWLKARDYVEGVLTEAFLKDYNERAKKDSK